MIRLCILDFDGTLCGTHNAIRHCVDLTFDHYGIGRPAPDRVDAVIAAGVVMEEAMSVLLGGRSNGPEAKLWAATYRRFYAEHGLEHTFLFPEIERTLAALQKKGIAIVIVSNKSEGAVTKAMDHYGISSFINLFVCDPPGIPKKPDPACYASLISPAFPDVSANEVVVVGDTDADLGLARNIGAHACWAAYGYGDPARCLEMSPDGVIQRFENLVEYLGAFR